MMQRVLSKFWEEWEREIPLSKKLCQLFSVNDGSTFEVKGLYLLALALMVLYVMVSIPFVLWAYLLYAFGTVLLIASGIMFIRTFINKASWPKKDSENDPS